MITEDIIIIGAGPAGIGAALQLNRYGIRPLLIERNRIGGLLNNANLIENYPGFPNGIPGTRLVKLFEKQLLKNMNRVVYENVNRVTFEKDRFIIKSDKNEYSSRILIIASGTRAMLPGEINIDSSIKDKVFTEIYTISGEKGKHISIIGAGDAAFDYALNLSENNSISILNRSDRTKCLEILKKNALNAYNIEYIENISVQSVLPGSGGLILECNAEGQKQHRESDFIVFATGRDGNKDFLPEEILLKKNELVAGGKLFFIGDVENGRYRQSAIAAGEGVKAAMKAYDTLWGES